MLSPRFLNPAIVGGEGYNRFEYGQFVPGHETFDLPCLEYRQPSGLSSIGKTEHGNAVNQVSVKPPWYYADDPLTNGVRPEFLRTVAGLTSPAARYVHLGRVSVGAPNMREA